MARKLDAKPRRFYSVAQAAEYLGLSHRMVSRYCKAKRLKAEHIDGLGYVILAADLRKFAQIPRFVGHPSAD